MTWRRLGAFIRYLPRDSATIQAVVGDEVRWGDTEYLLAMVVDGLAHVDWRITAAWFKDAPKRPPRPVQRPVDLVAADGETASRNLGARESFGTGAGLSIEEVDRLIEAHTGAPHGIAPGG